LNELFKGEKEEFRPQPKDAEEDEESKNLIK
jgi:hypothetical protein